MYKATIKTKYNTIILNIEDTNDEQFKEICEQPYVIEIKIEKEKALNLKKEEDNGSR